jgi:hypothetical protein
LGAIWAVSNRVKAGYMEFEESDIEIWMLRTMSFPGMRTAWEEELKFAYPKSFRDVVEEAIEKAGKETT